MEVGRGLMNVPPPNELSPAIATTPLMMGLRGAQMAHHALDSWGEVSELAGDFFVGMDRRDSSFERFQIHEPGGQPAASHNVGGPAVVRNSIDPDPQTAWIS